MFIVAVFAAGFYINNTPRTDIGLAEAGEVLGDRFGNAAKIIWAIGLLAAGQSSTMTGTFAGQFVMQGFLNLKISPWLRTTITRLFAIVPTMIVALLFAKNLDALDQGLNILQSIQLPFALIPLLTFSSSGTILSSFRLQWKLKGVFWAIVLGIIGINIYLTITSLQEMSLSLAGVSTLALFGLIYLVVVSYLMIFKAFKKPRYHSLSDQETERMLVVGEVE